MRSSRFVVVVSIVAALSAVAAGGPTMARPSPATAAESEPPEGWFNLPYLTNYGWFRVATNSETFGAKRISNASPLTQPYPGPTTEENQGKGLESIWATKCQKKKAQKVSFERKVFLPGVPDKLQASLFAQTVSSYAPAPVTQIALKINGTTILQHNKADVSHYPERTLVDLSNYGSEFVYGENTITVTAKKKATKKPHPQAGEYCTGDNIWGIAAELYGEFTADVQTIGPVPGTPSQGSSTGAIIPMTITNHGPSDLFTGAGQFRFAATSSQVSVTQLIAGVDGSGQAVLQDCSTSSYNDGRGDGFRALCPLPHMAPGESLSFSVLVGFEGLDCPDDKIWFDYGATGYFEETTLGDNGRSDGGLQPGSC
jgi:hypothetical protein